MSPLTGDELLNASSDLERYLQSYDSLLGRVENREHFRRFARGQLGPIQRKSLEPIADAEGANPRTLQFFFSQYKWDQVAVWARLRQHVAEQYGGPGGVFIIDETSDAKKGEYTPGVAPQYCGESGKIDNCIVSVHVAYARDGYQGLIDGELFLPESWNPNPDDPEVQEKRRRAEIPDDVVHEDKPTMALRQLQRAVNSGIEGSFTTADEGYGGKPWFRERVASMKLTYVFEVPKSTQGWTHEPRVIPPPKRKRTGGRPPGPRFSQIGRYRVDKLTAHRRGLRFLPWKRFKVHDTEKGPEVWEFKAAPFWEHSDGRPRELDQLLLVGRNVRTKDIKYFLSNAAPDTPIETLIYIAFSRWRVERCFQDCKTELGLNHAELRTYQGLHRHLALTAVNYFFLQDWMLKHVEKKKERVDCQPVCRLDREALSTPHRGNHDQTANEATGREAGERYRLDAGAQGRLSDISDAASRTRPEAAGDRYRPAGFVPV